MANNDILPSPSPDAMLTPKALADAIGASESSVRRWVDNGDIRISRTAGGHRRIPLAEAIRFIRQISATVVRPDLLGLVDMHAPEGGLIGMTDDQKLFEALRAGDRRTSRRLILAWYLEGRELAGLFDGPMRDALHRLGELWTHDPRGILIEHRASGICLDIIHALEAMLPPADDTAPLAIGAAPEGDPYQVPSLMASSVLAELGWRSVNFGPNTPIDLLANEAVTRGARLVWLSVSAPPGKTLRALVASLAAALQPHEIPLVIGGRSHSPCLTADTTYHALASMTELVGFARAMQGRAATR